MERRTIARYAAADCFPIRVFGNARIAVANALFAGHTGARFLLRLDETDLERSRKVIESNMVMGW